MCTRCEARGVMEAKGTSRTLDEPHPSPPRRGRVHKYAACACSSRGCGHVFPAHQDQKEPSIVPPGYKTATWKRDWLFVGLVPLPTLFFPPPPPPPLFVCVCVCVWVSGLAARDCVSHVVGGRGQSSVATGLTQTGRRGEPSCSRRVRNAPRNRGERSWACAVCGRCYHDPRIRAP